MTVIQENDLIESIADALQFISYYHPRDFIQAMAAAYEGERSESAKDAIAQILINSRMSAENHRPICQDTGIVTIFIKVGMNVRWNCQRSLDDMINEGVRQAYTNPGNPLRASIVAPPHGARKNTGDNTPAVIHTSIVPGDQVDVTVAAKGGGSENKSKFTILNPSDDLAAWIVETVPKLGAGWCPPGILGIGIGGTAEKAMLLAKEALMEPVNLHELKARGAKNPTEELRLQIHQEVNALGIGAQGLGGLTTVLDVKIREYPTHAVSLPVALIPNCAATRHAHFTLRGTGPVQLQRPALTDWPDISWDPGTSARRINLETITARDIQQWRPGETLLLSGKLLTGRDAAHKRLAEIFARGEPLPAGVNLDGRFIYYVGPVNAVGDEAVGPAGPTTATRMDKFTDTMLQHTGLLGMIGKAERGQATIDSLKQHRAVYLIAVGGAAYLVSKAIKKARILAFEDLGMEAIYEFEVEDMPVTVAVDSKGQSLHQSGPKFWKNKMAGIKGHHQRNTGMNLEKVIFAFFILLALTLNFGFFLGDMTDPEQHNGYELFAAIFVSLIATIIKFGDRTQLGAVLLATSLVADLQLVAAAVVWGFAVHITDSGLNAGVMSSIVSLSGGALLANIVSGVLLVIETVMIRR